MSAMSPEMLFMYRNEHYPSESDYHCAIADALRKEYEAISRAQGVLSMKPIVSRRLDRRTL